jgi:SNF2 family DNA or RNA helicase
MGAGKTSAAYAWGKFKKTNHTIVVSTGLAINNTWAKFLKANNEPYTLIKTLKDIEKAPANHFILISHDYMIKYSKHIKKMAKMLPGKISVVLDESDEITNHTSKRTRAIKTCFQRRATYKLLTTGTTTRNNIAELYSQLEFLYNNSLNMLSTARLIYVEDRKNKALDSETNPYFDEPFPPRHGNTLFKNCFNPSRTTVFGIQQHNQSIYNEDALRHIIEKTIITRKFKEIAGDKYEISSVEVFQNTHERHVYRVILKDFHTIVNQYFKSTGSARKDAGLKIVRQLQLLIDATSTPQHFKEYQSREAPNKALKIFSEIEDLNTLVCIGCTKLNALEWYEEELKTRFPDRPIFVVKGSVSFNKRGDIIDQFQASGNGILLCTQMSLKSSVNIPECDEVFIESKQWNIPKIEQFFFRFIRFNSKRFTRVRFFSYSNTIETNLMALLMAKERLNDYIKTLEYRENSDIYGEYDIDLDILNDLITREKDEDGKVQVRWGKAEVI